MAFKPFRFEFRSAMSACCLIVGLGLAACGDATATTAPASSTTAPAATTAPVSSTTAPAVTTAPVANATTAPAPAASPTIAATTAASPAASGSTMNVATAFVLKTLDPAREFEPTGGLVVHALYDTLVTFKGSDTTKIVPSLADSYTISSDGKTYTFTLHSGVKFANGDVLTADDVVFSLNRVKNIKGNPSFLLANMDTVTATNPQTVTLALKQPDPAILYILPNAALGVVNSKVVKANGGTDAADADKSDKAEDYFNKTSAGSGPYTLATYQVDTQVTLASNPTYWKGKVGLAGVTVKNVKDPATQALTLQKGDADIALDLNSDQGKGLSGDVQAVKATSAYVFFLIMNADPAVSGPTSKPQVNEAIRYALDYDGLKELGGDGAVQPPSVIPQGFLGALDPSTGIKRDVTKAKDLLKQAGYPNGFEIKMGYASDFALNGLKIETLAQKVQADLAEAGIKVTLAPSAISAALDNYRNAKDQMGLWFWGPDYPDPSDYLVFLPGQTVGKRANWKAGADADLEGYVTKAPTITDPDQRKALYQQMQQALIQRGPFAPFLQPGQVVGVRKAVTNFAFNQIWSVDFYEVGKSG